MMCSRRLFGESLDVMDFCECYGPYGFYAWRNTFPFDDFLFSSRGSSSLDDLALGQSP